MGTSTSVMEFAIKIDKFAKVQGRANRDATQAAAQVYKDRILANLAKDVGADLRMSRWGAKGQRSSGGIKLGVGYQVRGYEHATALIKAKPAGVWKVLEHGAAAHSVKPKKRRGARTAMIGSGYAHPVSHEIMIPQTRGKRTFSIAAKTAERPAVEVFQVAHARSVRKQIT